MLFGPNYSKAGPGVSPDEPRKKGIMRFFELVGRDFTSYWKASLFSTLCFIPYALIVSFGVYAGNLPVTLLGGIAGGALAGPCLAGLFDTVARTLRDEPGYWWHTYKAALRRNAKASLIPGALFGTLYATLLLSFALSPSTGFTGPAAVACMLFCLFVLTGAQTYCWLQLALLDLPTGPLLKNSILFTFAYLPRTLLAAVLQIAYWVVMYLFFPITLLVFAVTLLWMPALMGALAVYIPLEKAFQLEDRLRSMRAEEEAAQADRADKE